MQTEKRDINSNKSVTEEKVIESAISISPSQDSKQDAIAEEKCKRVI